MRFERSAPDITVGKLSTRVAFSPRTNGPDKRREFTTRRIKPGTVEKLTSRWPLTAEVVRRLTVRDGRGSAVTAAYGFNSLSGAEL